MINVSGAIALSSPAVSCGWCLSVILFAYGWQIAVAWTDELILVDVLMGTAYGARYVWED